MSTSPRYRDDPFTPFIERDPVADDVDVVIVGGGIAGVLAGASLRKAGVERIRIIDQAGGIGGTWYWNRYPGVMCDVESYIYLPMLEELDYIPTRRYAFGEEIRGHIETIADRFGLETDALFHTGVTRAEWDEDAARWRIRTDRGDEIRCRWYVLAVGILNLMKLPVIRGMEDFAGHSFHTARWDYDYTGGGPDLPLTGLEDKVVALIGTGASGIQCVPPLAESAKHLYVFQRTPSAIGVRGNRPTDPDFAHGLEPNWQRARMDNFQAILMGRPVDVDQVDDGWTHHYGPVQHPPRGKDMTMADYMRSAEAFDYSVMDTHRRRIEELVADPATAEILKPYYRYLCKRPCFHDEYLPSFNNPKVTLIDCPAGMEEITKQGPVIDGKQYEVDCIIYGTGFQAELTPLFRRVGHEIVGRGGITLAEKWADGAASLFGMMSRGLPNLFVMPAPGQQAVVTVNYTQLAVLGAEFIGGAVGLLEQQGVEVFDVSAEAEEAWTQKIVDTHVDSSSVMSACTPSRINNEGHPETMNPRNGNYWSRAGGLVRLPRTARTMARVRQLRGPGARGPVDGIVSGRQRVAVVTGGGGGIGAGIAEELGRGGWFVVTLDPLVTLDGSEQLPEPEETTAGRIVAAGGSAQASSVSVTDGEAVRSLFHELVHDHGELDAVVNVAGITRQTYFGRGTEADWLAVLSVHLEGYLNVLDAALPLMAAAGHGRVLGVTSGSGWRAADAGAYSCAKRAVAALTWQLGRQAPPGVTINAMSPIAATRMMASALERARKAGESGGGGISFLSVASPEDLGPFGAYLVGEGFQWCSGRVLFAGGPEVAVIDDPHLIEVVRTDHVVSLARVLDDVIPTAFAKAESLQASTGGSNPRFGPIFDEPDPADVAQAQVRSCAIVIRPPAVGRVGDCRARGPVHPVSPGRVHSRLQRLRRRTELRSSRRSDRRSRGRSRRSSADGLPDGRLGAGARRAPRNRRAHPYRRRMGPGGCRLRSRRRPACPAGDPHRRRHHGRTQSRPGLGPACAGCGRRHGRAGHGLRGEHRSSGGGGRSTRR